MLNKYKTDWSMAVNFDKVNEEAFLKLLSKKEDLKLIILLLYIYAHGGIMSNKHAAKELGIPVGRVSQWRGRLIELGIIMDGRKDPRREVLSGIDKPQKTPKPKAKPSDEARDVLTHFLAKKRAGYAHFKLIEGDDEFAMAVDKLVKKIGCPYSDVIRAIDIMLADKKWHANKLTGSKWLVKSFQEVIGSTTTGREVSHGGQRTVTSGGGGGL